MNGKSKKAPPFLMNGYFNLRGELPQTFEANGHQLSSKVRIQCISGLDTLANAFLPSNSPQIERST